MKSENSQTAKCNIINAKNFIRGEGILKTDTQIHTKE